MPLFELPQKVGDGWGPSTVAAAQDLNYPIDNINRYPPARVGKACDFTQGTQDRIRQMQAKELATGRKNYWMPTQPLIEADGYALVDTKHAAKKKQQSNFRRNFNQSRAMQQKQLKQGAHQDGFLGQTKKPKIEKIKKDPKGKGGLYCTGFWVGSSAGPQRGCGGDGSSSSAGDVGVHLSLWGSNSFFQRRHRTGVNKLWPVACCQVYSSIHIAFQPLSHTIFTTNLPPPPYNAVVLVMAF